MINRVAREPAQRGGHAALGWPALVARGASQSISWGASLASAARQQRPKQRRRRFTLPAARNGLARHQ